MHITIGIAGGCGAALLVAGVLVIKRARKSKVPSQNNGASGGGKPVGHFSPNVGVGGMSTFNPSFMGGVPEERAYAV